MVFGLHTTKQFMDYCDQHKILVPCLPPHSSHLLQPLDVIVFQPFKYYHAEAVEATTRMGCGDFGKVEFHDKIDSIHQQTSKPSTIQSAFRATGLIPFNPSIVISKLKEVVPLITYAPAEHPGPSSSGIPLNIPSLRVQGEELLRHAKNMPREFQLHIKEVLQGGLVLAQSAALAKEHMENTQAAEQARSARRSIQNRRQVQKGGVLYASEARQMVKKREDLEVEKAEKQLVKAQNAKNKADKAARKPFLHDIKAAQKARCARVVAKSLRKCFHPPLDDPNYIWPPLV